MLIRDMNLEQVKRIIENGFNYLYLRDVITMCEKTNNPNEYWNSMKLMIKEDIMKTNIQIKHVLYIDGKATTECEEY